MFLRGADNPDALVPGHVLIIVAEFRLELALTYIADMAGKLFAQDRHAAVFCSQVRMVIRAVEESFDAVSL